MAGADELWVIGDDFACHTFDEYFRQIKHAGEPDTFTFKNYEVRAFLSKNDSFNRNPAGRLINNLVKGLNEHKKLPKLILFILDDDTIKHIKFNAGSEVYVQKISTWLVAETGKAVDICKDFYPQKAIRDKEPHVLWISPPTHKYFGKNNNKMRVMQSNSLFENTKLRQDMSVLTMKKFWDHEDGNAFIYESYRFTHEGLMRYWQSIDSAVRFWTVALYPKIGQKHAKAVHKFARYGNQYKWNKNQNRTKGQERNKFLNEY